MSEPTDETFSWDDLSPREEDIVRGITLGLTNHEIADVLAISVKTYDTHRGNILYKVGVRNTVELTRKALRDGFASLEEADEYDGPARCKILADYAARGPQAAGVDSDGGGGLARGMLDEGSRVS